MTVDLWCGRIRFHWLDYGSDRVCSADGKEMEAKLNLELFSLFWVFFLNSCAMSLGTCSYKTDDIFKSHFCNIHSSYFAKSR